MSTDNQLENDNPYLLKMVKDGVVSWIPWSPPGDLWNTVVVERPKVPKVATCLAEEVWELVQEAYRLQGKGVPPAEAKVLLAEIKKEKERLKEEANKLVEEAANAPLNAPVGKPEYGSPEFWKAYWEKKRAAGWVPKKESLKKEKAKKKEK
jgi:hypothetical protein